MDSAAYGSTEWIIKEKTRSWERGGKKCLRGLEMGELEVKIQSQYIVYMLDVLNK